MSEGSQQRLLPALDPDDLVLQAKAEHEPIRTYCLFSGGNDSLVTAHRCLEHYDELVFIDTGTAVPGVLQHVENCAAWLGKPLRVMTQPFDAYALLVLGGEDWKGDVWNALGFPGPAQHGRAYNRLKERCIEQLLRETKEGHPRRARVLSLTGVRRAESARRRNREPINRKASMVFCNPIIDWDNAQMNAYRRDMREAGAPESDVAALLHRSGECNCGAFAEPGEREMLRSLWPEWFDERIGALEREAEERGLPYCKWGAGRRARTAEEFDAGELCSSCEFRQASLLEAGAG